MGAYFYHDVRWSWSWVFDGWREYRQGSSTWSGKKNEQAFEAEGRSRGGLSTKIHAAVDALGNPIRFILTQGQASEYEQANAMIAGFQAAISQLTTVRMEEDLTT